VVGANFFLAGKVGNGTGYLEDSIIGTGREGKFLHGLLEEVALFPADGTVTANLTVLHAGVTGGIGAYKTDNLKIACNGDTLTDGGGRFPRFTAAEFLDGECGNLDMKVDAIK
jgi:hypothetical protein